jgi:flagellar protein FliO/FliZ
MTRLLFAAAATTAAVAIQAAATAPAAVPPLLQASPTFMGFVQVLFSLLLVVAAIFATAWLAKRFGPGHIAGAGQLKVVSGVMVGSKERVVVVEVRDTWLVLGVTPNGISTLHSLPRPEDAPVASPAGLPFAERVAAAIKARQSKPADGVQS